MQADSKIQRFSWWFYAAAFYNFVWGIAAIFFPRALFRAVGLPLPNYMPLFQCIGMMVMVYAVGYYLLAKNPVRFAHFVWIGLLGKTFGPMGFVWSATRGELPWSFGVNLLFNDVVWWPAFWTFALRYARGPIQGPKLD